MKLKFLLLIAFITFFSEEGRTQNASQLVQKSLSQQHFEVGDAQYRITSEHISTTSGVHHIRFLQKVNDLPVKGTESSIHISKTGRVVSESIQFIGTSSNLFINSEVAISPIAVVELVARYMGYRLRTPLNLMKKDNALPNEIWLSDGGISAQDIRTQLVYAINDKDTYDLVWEIEIREPEGEHWWIIQLNAENGSFMGKVDIMQNCYPFDYEEPLLDYNKNLYNIENSKTSNTPTISSCENCYEVFALPLDSPYFGDRTIVKNPADVIASPYGWHDWNGEVGAESTLTLGNNARAFEANDNFGYQPDGTGALNFTGYAFDQEYTENFQYEDASITNVFYWANILHDVTYRYGFTENAGNFQQTNYLNVGAGADEVIIECQSIFRPCNASFSTQREGISPVLKVNLCNDKDGGFDASVIAHEWGHGLSDRLTGGWFDCLRNKESPSEGWSDWLAVVLTIKSGDTGATPRTIATYLRNQGPDGPGVRRFPYSTDMNVNPQTYESLVTTVGTHHIGAIWSEILWEMTWGLIDAFGFDPNIYSFTGDTNQDAGNIIAMAIVIEGLKFTVCKPGFVQARDAIMRAAWEIYGGDVVCVLWESFARRGLGYFAEQGSSEITTDGVASFEVQDAFTAGFDGPDAPFCLNSTYEYLDGGYPLGGTYSGVGVVDNGDGLTFNFDPLIAGVGVHKATYYLPQTSCSKASEASVDFIVKADITPPELQCIQDFTVRLPRGETYPLQYFVDRIILSDDCPGELDIVQTPEVGTLLSDPSNEITFTVIDVAGNQASCSFFLFIEFVTDGQFDLGLLTLFPNPGSNEITLNNPKGKTIEFLEIWDLLGSRVSYLPLNNQEVENRFSVEALASGMYLIRIKVAGNEEILRLVKL